MERKIPVYFDSIIIDSPVREAVVNNDQTIYRMKVRVFSKGANRNGSYITDAVAQQLIDSAVKGTTPVVGFFDPETNSWASHTGPTLAKAYGYVEDFLGWEPFEDTDGVVRDYAVFSIVAFSDYFDEANNILGQNQSMELNEKSIQGDWAQIGEDYYFVYTVAKMKGFCIIGSHEPCFSVSAFFSQNEDALNIQYNKFSSLLSELKAQVEEAKKINRGGEQAMDKFENDTPAEEVVVEQLSTEEATAEQVEATTTFAESAELSEEPAEEVEATATEEVEVAAEPEAVEEVVEEQPAAEEPSEYDLLQQQYQNLQESNAELQSNFDAAQARISELEAQIAEAEAKFAEAAENIAHLNETIGAFEAREKAQINENKKRLIENYRKLISEEEISEYEAQLNDFSYDELEGKLAICFAKKQLAGGETEMVPLPEQKDNEFATFMAKYRK